MAPTYRRSRFKKGIQFATSNNAKVTGFHVMPEFHVFTYRTKMLEDTKERFARDSRAHAEHYLAVIEKAAKEAGVTCDTAYATSDHPYEAIIRAAEEKGCDLIMMASHGRRGVQGLLIGSETHKVLTPSQIPVAGVPLSVARSTQAVTIKEMRPLVAADSLRSPLNSIG